MIQVATFIIQKILLDDMGLKWDFASSLMMDSVFHLYPFCVPVCPCVPCCSYICATYERFSTVSSVLRFAFRFRFLHAVRSHAGAYVSPRVSRDCSG